MNKHTFSVSNQNLVSISNMVADFLVNNVGWNDLGNVQVNNVNINNTSYNLRFRLISNKRGQVLFFENNEDDNNNVRVCWWLSNRTAPPYVNNTLFNYDMNIRVNGAKIPVSNNSGNLNPNVIGNYVLYYDDYSFVLIHLSVQNNIVSNNNYFLTGYNKVMYFESFNSNTCILSNGLGNFTDISYTMGKCLKNFIVMLNKQNYYNSNKSYITGSIDLSRGNVNNANELEVGILTPVFPASPFIDLYITPITYIIRGSQVLKSNIVYYAGSLNNIPEGYNYYIGSNTFELYTFSPNNINNMIPRLYFAVRR